MTDKFLACNINLFSKNQDIILIENSDFNNATITSCDLSDLGKTLTDICFSENIDTIHIYGNEEFIKKIINDIDIHSGCSAYSNNMIKVEVNK